MKFRIKQQFTLLHRWLGVPLGLIFLLTFATGGITALDELIKHGTRAISAEQVASLPSKQQLVTAIPALLAKHPDSRVLYTPSKEVPFYRLSTRQQVWHYAADGVTLVKHDKNRKNDGFFRTVLQLHRNLLLGKQGIAGVGGNKLVAWVSLLALLLSVIGVWLWWPRRSKFSVKDVMPRGNKRKHFYLSHMSAGVVSLISILLLALTGATITYRDVAKQWLDASPQEMTTEVNIPVATSWSSRLLMAERQLSPQAELVRIRFTTQQRAKDKQQVQAKLAQLRFSTQDDWFGLARSTVTINLANSSIVAVSAFGELSFSQKLYTVLVALHTGHDLPWGYTFVLLVFSVIGSLMVFSGVWSFLLKHWKKRKSPASVLSRLKPAAVKQG